MQRRNNCWELITVFFLASQYSASLYKDLFWCGFLILDFVTNIGTSGVYTAWNFLYDEPNESESANYTERAVSNYVNMNTVNYIGSDKLIVL